MVSLKLWPLQHPPSITIEQHISQLQRFLVTVFYIENYLVSRLIHCLLLGINQETACICVSSVRKMGRYFLQVQLLRLGRNDTQLNRCCLLKQLRNGIDAVPEGLYRCLFKRCWMNQRNLSILSFLLLFLYLLEGHFFIAGEICYNNEKK